MKLVNRALVLYVIATASYVAGVEIGPGKDGKSAVYKALSVPSTITETLGNTILRRITSNEMSCVLQVKKHPWCNLFCYKEETHVCTLYDISLPANYEAENDDNPKIPCYTNVPEGCVYGNQTYQEGDTWQGKCFELICKEGAKIDSTTTFTQITGAGSILVVDNFLASFDDAQMCCNDGGVSQLVIPKNFMALSQYMVTNHPGKWFWIGISNNKWMDGSIVEQDYWHPYQDMDVSFCGYVETRTSSAQGKIVTNNCASEYPFICQNI